VGCDDFRLTSRHTRLSRERRRADELRKVLEAVNGTAAMCDTGQHPGRRARRIRPDFPRFHPAGRWLVGAAFGLVLAVAGGLGTELFILWAQAR
jgi:hypothetical protein